MPNETTDAPCPSKTVKQNEEKVPQCKYHYIVLTNFDPSNKTFSLSGAVPASSPPGQDKQKQDKSSSGSGAAPAQKQQENKKKKKK